MKFLVAASALLAARSTSQLVCIMPHLITMCRVSFPSLATKRAPFPCIHGVTHKPRHFIFRRYRVSSGWNSILEDTIRQPRDFGWHVVVVYRCILLLLAESQEGTARFQGRRWRRGAREAYSRRRSVVPRERGQGAPDGAELCRLRERHGRCHHDLRSCL